MEGKVRELLKGRGVLVTGADGFVGSALTETLVEYGADVHVLVRPISAGMLHNLSHLREKIKIHRVDLTDKHAVVQGLKQFAKQIDKQKPIIHHLAAQVHVGESWNRPYETINTVVLGTLNLLQSIVDIGLEIFKIDMAGTSEEYGNIKPELQHLYRFDDNGGLVLDEKSPLNPQSIYATAKVAADFLTRNYYAAYGIPGVITRKFNNYGPRQNPRYITGTIITQALTREYIELGALEPKRDFCFVKDGALGHMYSALFGEPGDVYVCGFGQTISMGDWYRLIMDIGREEGYWKEKELRAKEMPRKRLGSSDVMELRSDFSKLNALTGWKPRYPWVEGLRQTIRWYAENREKWISLVDW